MRHNGLVILRAIAIVGIVVCHICLQLGYEPMGRVTGFLFVQIFLFMSAYLFGLNGGGNKDTCIRFVWKRWKKISATYYPFLAISVTVLLLTHNEVTVKNVITHVTYTNYFLKDSICGISFGHLWYLSMMMLCYVGIGMLKSGRQWMHRCLNGYGIVAVSFLGILAGKMLQELGTSSRIVFLFVSYLLVYVHADDIRRFAMRQKGTMAWGVFVVSNIVCFGLFFVPGFYDMLMIRDSVIIVTALAWLCVFLRMPETTDCGKAVRYVSTVSFEIYLVHQPVIFGQFSLIGKLGLGIAFEIAIALTLTMVLAAMLNGVGKRIQKYT